MRHDRQQPSTCGPKDEAINQHVNIRSSTKALNWGTGYLNRVRLIAKGHITPQSNALLENSKSKFSQNTINLLSIKVATFFDS